VTRRLLAITGGHRFDADAFTDLVESIATTLGWSWEHATQPEAQRWLRPAHAGEFAAILLHDLPGLELARGREPVVRAALPDVRQAMLEMLAAGQGIVATHHALAGWPDWDEWARVLGGRFLYAPGSLGGEPLAASGYRLDRYRVIPVHAAHPVCAGVGEFELTDELYLCQVFDDAVSPLFVTDADLSPQLMIDTHHEVVHGEQRASIGDRAASPLLAWEQQVANSRVVYVLPGHSAETLRHPQYQRLLANAMRWVSESTLERAQTDTSR
jgi:type 1 glutamine amidotransferase